MHRANHSLVSNTCIALFLERLQEKDELRQREINHPGSVFRCTNKLSQTTRLRMTIHKPGASPSIGRKTLQRDRCQELRAFIWFFSMLRLLFLMLSRFTQTQNAPLTRAPAFRMTPIFPVPIPMRASLPRKAISGGSSGEHWPSSALIKDDNRRSRWPSRGSFKNRGESAQPLHS